jgi:hypothetical protein
MNLAIPAAVEQITTRVDGSLKLSFGTPELSADTCGELFKYRRKEVLLVLSTKDLNAEQVQSISTAREHISTAIKEKTPSQRLRAVLYRVWEQEAQTLEFNEYYTNTIEQIIEHYKTKINAQP